MSRQSLVRRVLTAATLGMLSLVAAPATAHAHTDFDYSLPTDGASVGTPLDQVTVAFTLPVTLVGNGFEVLDPQNNVLLPFAVTDDDKVFRLQFDPPLAGGTVAVKYEVQAEDGHVLMGNFVFVVDAPPPTTTIETTTTTTTTAPVVTTSSPAVEVTTTSAAAATAEEGSTSPSTTAADAAPSTSTVTSDEVAAAGTDDGGSGTGVIIAIAAAVALAAGGFVLIRSRTSDAA